VEHKSRCGRLPSGNRVHHLPFDVTGRGFGLPDSRFPSIFAVFSLSLPDAAAVFSQPRQRRAQSASMRVGCNSMSLEADFVMPPQPLSRVRPNAIVMASPDAIVLRPKLAPLIAEIIARWADIEANIGSILSYILRAEAAPTAAMLYAIRSSSAQIEMVLAAGSVKLFDPELEIFEAVIQTAKTVAKKRNHIAHHVWAYTTELPEALLLIEPEAYSDMFVELQEAFKLPSAGWTFLHPDRERTWVYRENDFLQIITDLKTVARCTTFLINYLQPKHIARDRMYSTLCSEPSIDAALLSIRKNRPPRPAPPQPNQ
jgi:hypothetical protein